MYVINLNTQDGTKKFITKTSVIYNWLKVKKFYTSEG